jgi:hypothetical protein
VGGQTIANSVIAPVSASGEVCFFVYGTAHLIADVSGYFPTGSGFASLLPARVLDTRGGVKVGNAAGTAVPYVLQVLGKGGVPSSGVGAVALNVTVTLTEDPTVGGGYVTVFPCGTRPDASNLNFVGGQTIANSVIAPVSASGEVCFFVYGTAHLIADVSGYFPTGSPPRPPTTTTTPGGTTSTSGLLAFEVDRLVTTADRGFPWNQPPMASANGNWTSPIDYAGGRLHFRAEIKAGGQPVAKSMKLQFCVWQDNLTRETCSSTRTIVGSPGNVVEWSEQISSMWKKDGVPIDWTRARQRYGIAIKNMDNNPVSDFSGWNWFGEDPAEWYPLDLRFTVRAVPAGKTFAGW